MRQSSDSLQAGFFAIMVFHGLYPGVEICILVDGQPLEEYDCKNDKVQQEIGAVYKHQMKCTVTRYVKSVTGKNFAVSFKVDPSFKMPCTSMSFCISVDGQLVSTFYMIGKERQQDRPRPELSSRFWIRIPRRISLKSIGEFS